MRGFFAFMVTVYVLISLKDEATYVGMALDAAKRLKEHNSGKNRYTKSSSSMENNLYRRTSGLGCGQDQRKVS